MKTLTIPSFKKNSFVTTWICLTMVVAQSAAQDLSNVTIVNGQRISSGATNLVRETRTQTTAHVANKAIEVVTENGSVTITKSTGQEVTITTRLAAETAERLKQTTVSVTRGSNKTLHVNILWPGGVRKPSEGASIDIAIPDVNGAKVGSSNGAVKLTDLRGAAVLNTSNGPITVENHDGTVHANTSNGPISIVFGPSASGPVIADTSNGPINIVLGAKGIGPVNAQTSNGPIRLQVSAAFIGTVSTDTSNGRIRNTSTRAQVVGNATATEADFQFGTGGGTSTLSTSNGSVDISDAAGAPRKQ